MKKPPEGGLKFQGQIRPALLLAKISGPDKQEAFPIRAYLGCNHN